jgi:hypothetical protein
MMAFITEHHVGFLVGLTRRSGSRRGGAIGAISTT